MFKSRGDLNCISGGPLRGTYFFFLPFFSSSSRSSMRTLKRESTTNIFVAAIHPDALAFIEYLDVDFLKIFDLVPAEFDREGVLEYHLVESAAEVFPDFLGEGFDLDR